MKHDLPSWPRLALTAAVVVTLGAGVTTAAVVLGAVDGNDDQPGTHGIRLVSYDSCDTALTELKDRVLPQVGAYGLYSFGESGPYGVPAMPAEGDAADGGAGRAEAPGAAPMEDKAAAPEQSQSESPEHSTTNVNEAGVDEPDLVKTDGRRNPAAPRPTPTRTPRSSYSST